MGFSTLPHEASNGRDGPRRGSFAGHESFAVPPPTTDDLLNQREADAGAEINRLTISWADVDRDRNVQDWTIYDRRIASIEAAGMQPLIILQGSPSWARTGLHCNSRPVVCPPDDAHMANWERFAYQVATRYPNAAAIEVWNEPNWYGSWPTNGGPDPERYARMFRLASGAIKFVDSEESDSLARRVQSKPPGRETHHSKAQSKQESAARSATSLPSRPFYLGNTRVLSHHLA